MSHRSRVQAPQGVCYEYAVFAHTRKLSLHPPKQCFTLWLPHLADTIDSLPEWSKGVDSSSTSASCVGSNPTAVRPAWGMQLHASPSSKHMRTSGRMGRGAACAVNSVFATTNQGQFARVVSGGGLKFH